MKTTFLFVLIVCGSFLCMQFYPFSTHDQKQLSTHFHYTQQELSSLSSLPAPQIEITQRDAQWWQNVLFTLIKQEKLMDVETANLIAYFFTAQREAAFLMYNHFKCFGGSLDYVSYGVLSLFFPSSKLSSLPSGESDAISELVLNKVKARMAKDKKLQKLYPEKKGNQYWSGVSPAVGQDAGSRIPWVIQSADRFRALPPPDPNDPEWQRQLVLTQKALDNATQEQKIEVIFWAGGPGTISPPGLWIQVATEYMNTQYVPLAKLLLVKSILSMSLADAVISAFDSKYTYWTKRPFMLAPEMITTMPTPPYPSYPAGHSTLAFAAAGVLIYFFPEQKTHWLELAETASQSRVWGGIDFPIDVQAGRIQGEAIGKAYITMLQKI